MINHLYTTSDIKNERKRLYELQKGIDPILEQEFDFRESTCDHDHVTQHTRAALHRQSNAFEGKVFNAYKRCLGWLTDKPLPDILRNLAEYLEKDYSNNPLHPHWVKSTVTKFRALNEEMKKHVLKGMARPEGLNSKERIETFDKALKSRQFTMTQVEDLMKRAKGLR
jgi:hypothetical protein